MRMAYSEEDAISALQKAADQLGHSPTFREYSSLDISPSNATIQRLFSDWNEAKEAAGLGTNTTSRGVSKQECVESLRKVAKDLGRSPTRTEYHSYNPTPAVSVVESKFGGWNNAKEAAGLETWQSDEYQYDVCSEYFKVVDDAETAYWLGLIYADGSVSESGVFSISLQEEDGYLIRDLVSDIGSTYAVSNTKEGLISTNVYDDGFVQNLQKQGVTPNKTFGDTSPDLSAEYYSAFLRGIFDGDGSFTTKSRNRVQWSIYSHNDYRRVDLVDWLQSIGVDSIHKGERGVHVTNRSDIETIWRELYPRGTDTYPSMERKTSSIKEYVDNE